MLQADFVQTRLSKSTAFRITVVNRDYHYQSRFEIGGGKRISQHLSGAKSASHAQNLVSDCPTYQTVGLFLSLIPPLLPERNCPRLCQG
jgi:hypothetical protein